METLEILRNEFSLLIPLLVGIFCFKYLNLFLKLQYLFLVVGIISMFFQPPPQKTLNFSDQVMHFPEGQKHFAYMVPKNKWNTSIPVIIGMSTTCFFACLFVKDKKQRLLITALFFVFTGFVFYYTIQDITSFFPMHLYRILGSITTVVIYIIMLYSSFKRFLVTGKYPPEIYLIIDGILSCSVTLPSISLEWYCYRNDFLNILMDYILPCIGSALLAASFWINHPRRLCICFRTKTQEK